MVNLSDPYCIRCPSCSQSYTLQRGMIPEQGALIRCKKCKHPFEVRPPTVERARVWVLAGDPAIVRSGLADEAGLLDNVDVCILDAKGRGQLLSAWFAETLNPPDVLVYGDMHVLLRDELLGVLGSAKGVRRVRVCTHENPELAAEARKYVGFDHQICLPVAMGELRTTLLTALSRQDRHRVTAERSAS